MASDDEDDVQFALPVHFQRTLAFVFRVQNRNSFSHMLGVSPFLPKTRKQAKRLSSVDETKSNETLVWLMIHWDGSFLLAISSAN